MKKFLAILAVVALVAFAAPAFAANPFMDVPAGHWAYDAVAQLAASGVVSGYPDGAFKGAQPATRYEVASVVARALAKVDAEKASKQDLEMLKKLVMEFKDELDALGVKVDKIDKRVAVLEDRLGGWKLNGEFRFDAKFAGNHDGDVNNYIADKKEFGLSRARFHFTKFIDENTKFYGRLNGEGATWDRFYIDTKLPYDINFRVGKFNFDWEGDLGFYNGGENDATFGDFDTYGFQFQKQWGIVKATAVLGRETALADIDTDSKFESNTHMLYALNLHADFNEKFRAGAMGYWFIEDDQPVADDEIGNVNTYGLYAGFDFTPAVTLQGLYYFQNFDAKNLLAPVTNDSPKSWKAQLAIKQDLLKFTGLWIEYAQEDNTFVGRNNMDGGNGAYDWDGNAQVLANRQINDETMKVWFVRADQKWNDKWSSFLRYTKADFDTANVDDTQAWTVGVALQYTPAINFQLAYDNIDYGDGVGLKGSENLLRFRTYVSF